MTEHDQETGTVDIPASQYPNNIRKRVSKAEKKIKKSLEKLGLVEFPGVARASIRQARVSRLHVWKWLCYLNILFEFLGFSKIFFTFHNMHASHVSNFLWESLLAFGSLHMKCTNCVRHVDSFFGHFQLNWRFEAHDVAPLVRESMLHWFQCQLWMVSNVSHPTSFSPFRFLSSCFVHFQLTSQSEDAQWVAKRAHTIIHFLEESFSRALVPWESRWFHFRVFNGEDHRVHEQFVGKSCTWPRKWKLWSCCFDKCAFQGFHCFSFLRWFSSSKALDSVIPSFLHPLTSFSFFRSQFHSTCAHFQLFISLFSLSLPFLKKLICSF